jgi:FkbM family methyltransferase
MIDVGAHQGTTLAPFLRHDWRVVAFEPVEENRRKLAARFADHPRLAIRGEAVSDRSGRRPLQLALHPDGRLHDYYHSLEQVGEDPWHRKGGTIEVPTVALDDLVARGELPSRVGFLKIDTEGHDLAVLRGAARLGCEVVSIEFWNDGNAQGPSPSPARTMLELLRERGLEKFIAITHFLDQTEVFFSTLEGPRPEAMGNLVVFHRSHTDLYHRIRDDPDWEVVLEQSRRFDRLNREVREKQAVIEELAGALEQYRRQEPGRPKRRWPRPFLGEMAGLLGRLRLRPGRACRS